MNKLQKKTIALLILLTPLYQAHACTKIYTNNQLILFSVLILAISISSFLLVKKFSKKERQRLNIYGLIVLATISLLLAGPIINLIPFMFVKCDGTIERLNEF